MGNRDPPTYHQSMKTRLSYHLFTIIPMNFKESSQIWKIVTATSPCWAAIPTPDTGQQWWASSFVSSSSKCYMFNHQFIFTGQMLTLPWGCHLPPHGSPFALQLQAWLCVPLYHIVWFASRTFSWRTCSSVKEYQLTVVHAVYRRECKRGGT